jgi:solute carrier family 25 carnitine/acylcarnitine transporter 20/29
MKDDAAIGELKMTETKKKQASSSGLKNFFAGGVGGVCCVATGHPLDTIKVEYYCMFKEFK